MNRLTRSWLTVPWLLASLNLAGAADAKPLLLEGGLLAMGGSREGGHQGAVLPVAFAPRGDVLASGSQDKTIVLWDPVTGTRRRTLRGHEDWVTALAFTRDGKRLASGQCNTCWVCG